MKLIKLINLFFYYNFARHLPSSDKRGFRWVRKIRELFCSRIFKKCGKNVNIERGAYFGNGFEIEIGDNSGIGINSKISMPIKIGKDVMMGPDVIILTSTHGFDKLDIPMRKQGYKEPRAVAIKDDVWIGTRVIILPGVTIGRGSIIGAGTIVTKDVPAYSIFCGNPGRVVKYRSNL